MQSSKRQQSNWGEWVGVLNKVVWKYYSSYWVPINSCAVVKGGNELPCFRKKTISVDFSAVACKEKLNPLSVWIPGNPVHCWREELLLLFLSRSTDQKKRKEMTEIVTLLNSLPRKQRSLLFLRVNREVFLPSFSFSLEHENSLHERTIWKFSLKQISFSFYLFPTKVQTEWASQSNL